MMIIYKMFIYINYISCRPNIHSLMNKAPNLINYI